MTGWLTDCSLPTSPLQLIARRPSIHRLSLSVHIGFPLSFPFPFPLSPSAMDTQQQPSSLKQKREERAPLASPVRGTACCGRANGRGQLPIRSPALHALECSSSCSCDSLCVLACGCAQAKVSGWRQRRRRAASMQHCPAWPRQLAPPSACMSAHDAVRAAAFGDC